MEGFYILYKIILNYGFPFSQMFFDKVIVTKSLSHLWSLILHIFHRYFSWLYKRLDVLLNFFKRQELMLLLMTLEIESNYWNFECFVSILFERWIIKSNPFPVILVINLKLQYQMNRRIDSNKKVCSSVYVCVCVCVWKGVSHLESTYLSLPNILIIFTWKLSNSTKE